MKLVIQRVIEAKVEVEGKVVGAIGPGALVLLGIHKEDKESQIVPMVDKLLHLRFFRDEQDKMNKSLLDIKGELLVVSQFTLYANTKSGRRPSFTDAAPPDMANALYTQFVTLARQKLEKVETGIFGAYMHVSLVNDGPVTLILEDPSR